MSLKVKKNGNKDRGRLTKNKMFYKKKKILDFSVNGCLTPNFYLKFFMSIY